MDFKTVISEIEVNKDNHDKGYYNCIPFIGMERLEKILPGIEQSTYYILAASSGVGKSKLARHLFVHNPLMYMEDNPEEGVEVSIKYFSLEESRKKIILHEIAKYLYTKYSLIIDVKKLQSIGRYNTLTRDELLKVKEAEEHVTNFLSKVDIVDNIRNPTGIFMYVRDFALTIGKYYTKDDVPLTPQQHADVKYGKNDAYKLVSYYKKNNPKHYVIILIDHISLITPESGMTLHQTMSKLSAEHCITFRDKFGFIPVVIQQMSAGKETIDTNFQGKTIEQKLEPSLDALADNKLTQRDATIVLALMNPERYGITVHNGHDLPKLKGRYRSLSLLKNREGIADKRVPLFFNGAVDLFKEMPTLDNTEGLQMVYNHVAELNRI